jgi:hypothetical protein
MPVERLNACALGRTDLSPDAQARIQSLSAHLGFRSPISVETEPAAPEPRGRGWRRSWPPKWAALADRFKTVDDLADRLWTTRKVVTEWALGKKKPSPDSEERIISLSMSLGVESPIPIEPVIGHAQLMALEAKFEEERRENVSAINALVCSEIAPPILAWLKVRGAADADYEAINDVNDFVRKRILEAQSLGTDDVCTYSQPDMRPFWRPLFVAAGGVGPLQEKLGTTRKQLLAWMRGEKEPGRRMVEQLSSLAKSLKVRAPFPTEIERTIHRTTLRKRRSFERECEALEALVRELRSGPVHVLELVGTPSCRRVANGLSSNHLMELRLKTRVSS